MLLPKRFIALAALVLAVASGCSDGAPGGTEEGTVRSGEIELRWFLDFPEGDGPFPGVVYGPGSGDVSAASKSTVEFARELNELGFAVMRYDKRGVGGSGGELVAVSTANSGGTILRLASDMGAVLDELLANSRIDRERIGLVGASQATWYMPLVASEVDEVRFMIVLSGGLTPVGPHTFWEFQVFLNERDPFAPETLEVWRTYDGPTGFDQRPLVRDLDRPMLYLVGLADPVFPVQPFRDEVGLLQASGADITFRTYPQGGHVLVGIDFWDDVRAWLDGL